MDDMGRRLQGDIDAFLDDLKNTEPGKNDKSARALVFELYPQIQEAVDKGLKKREIFNLFGKHFGGTRLTLSSFYTYMSQAEAHHKDK